jgi:hypothetical protein
MGLFFPKDLEEVQKLNFQLQNLWTFDIYSFFSYPPPALNPQGQSVFAPSDFNNSMRFRIQSINLPRFKLETERQMNGDIYYSGFTFEDTVSMTIFETADMASHKYFYDWMNVIFDRTTMRFRVIDEFKKNSAFRKGVLKLYNYEANTWSIISSTLFNSTIKNMVEPTLRTKLSIPKTSNPIAQNFINTAFAGTSVIAGESVDNISNTILPQVSKKVSGSFLFNNMKIKSIDDHSFNYDSGDPLILTVNFDVESVTFAESNNLSVD